MWPSITIGLTPVYMTGIGIVVGLITFLFISFYFCRKYKLEREQIFVWIFLPLILSYILGSYSSFVFLTKSVVPSSRAEFTTIFSPYGFHFEYVGVIVALFVSMLIFFRPIKYPSQQAKWIDTFFFSFAGALVPLGLFLLLGDNFIGQVPLDGGGMEPLSTASARTKYQSVLPVGLYLSIASLIIFFAVGIYKRYHKKSGIGYVGLTVLVGAISLILVFSQYSRHLVILVGSMRFDIKQYIS